MKNYDIKNAVNELSNVQIHVDKKRIAFLVPNMFNRVKSGFIKNAGPNNNYDQPVDNAVQLNNVASSISESNTNVTVNTDSTLENQNVKPKEKNYGVIVSFSEAKKLHDNVIPATEPRKLLISQTFLGKLISNRKSKMVNDLVNEVPEITSNNVNTFDPVAKYHELISERTRLIESVKNIEAEITKLVRDNNLTQEQVSRVKVA